jgi:hypothetical protein
MVGISVRLSRTFVLTAIFLGGPLVVSVANADTGTSLELSLDGVLTSVPDEATSESADDDLTYKIYLYGWAPSISGHVAIGNHAAQVDASIGSVLSELQGVLSGRFEARSGPWLFFIDAMFADLGREQQLPLGGTLDVDFDQLVVAFGIGYRIGQWPLGDNEYPSVEAVVLGALQYTYLRLDITKTGVLPFERKESGDWVDPVIGGRIYLDFSENWSIVTLGYVGGFGIGSSSQLVWSLHAGVKWSINDWFALYLGYRILDYDYVRGDFEYDITLSGPYLAVSFSF